MTGLDSSPEMIEAARAAEPGRRLRGRRPPRLGRRRRPGRRARLQRHPPVGARPPRPAAALVARVRPGGWFAFQVPGNFDEPSHTIRTELAAEAPYAEHTAGVAVPASARPGDVPRRAGRARAAPSTPGRRRTSTCSPARTRSSPGSPAPAPGRPSRRCRTGCGRGFEDEFQARLAGGVPRPRATAWCCRSAGSSSSRRWRRHEAPPRPGRLPGRRRGRRPPLLGRRARADRGREARRPGRAAAAPGSGRTPTPARWRPRSTSASRTRSSRPARRTRRCCSTASRSWRRPPPGSTRLGFEVDWAERHTFPGHQRCHTLDGHGNRVELLA